ncbi:MAG TPA: glycosyltransferase [Thermoanaerobaculia bacterium]|nr:glycosyltransferase [Thermoanaerobaculia bacterium]
MNIVILGLSITSSWGNGHATTYRGLVRELAANGHDILFLERDVPWYASNRDLPEPPYCRTRLYRTLNQLKHRYTRHVREADLVIVGSYVPEGVAVGEWVTETAEGLTAFYDIDTPVTLAKLAQGDFEYLSPHLIPRYDMYLSFTGGPTLRRIEKKYKSPMARALYCSFDPEHYFPEKRRMKWDLGYLGTYSDDRQPTVERLLIEPAKKWRDGKFIVAGPQYPDDRIAWPRNVRRVTHLPPAEHRAFYNAQRFTLNVTRAAMIRAGWSPSVRLFEAAACAVPIISDWWDGLDSLFDPEREILIAETARDVLRFLRMNDDDRKRIGLRARTRVIDEHTAAHRATELEGYVAEALVPRSAGVLAG